MASRNLGTRVRRGLERVRRGACLIGAGLTRARLSTGLGRDEGVAGRPHIRQSAVIPYRVNERGNLEVLLITSRSRGSWIVPKGMLEPDMTEHDSAANEAMEEAGVLGRVTDEPAGTFTYRKTGRDYEVAVYELEVLTELSDWPERGERKRRWFDADEAARRVEIPELAALIRGLPDRVGA